MIREVRCVFCHKLMFKILHHDGIVIIESKCPKCKKVNRAQYEDNSAETETK